MIEPNFDNHIDDKFQDARDAGEKFDLFLEEHGWDVIVGHMKDHPGDQGEAAEYLYETFPNIMIAIDNQFKED